MAQSRDALREVLDPSYVDRAIGVWRGNEVEKKVKEHIEEPRSRFSVWKKLTACSERRKRFPLLGNDSLPV